MAEGVRLGGLDRIDSASAFFEPCRFLISSPRYHSKQWGSCHRAASLRSR